MSDLVEGLVIDVSHCSRESCESEARRVIGEFLRCLADDIRWWFPNPNPLGSPFDPYVGEQIAEYIEGLGA